MIFPIRPAFLLHYIKFAPRNHRIVNFFSHLFVYTVGSILRIDGSYAEPNDAFIGIGIIPHLYRLTVKLLDPIERQHYYIRYRRFQLIGSIGIHPPLIKGDYIDPVLKIRSAFIGKYNR